LIPGAISSCRGLLRLGITSLGAFFHYLKSAISAVVSFRGAVNKRILKRPPIQQDRGPRFEAQSIQGLMMLDNQNARGAQRTNEIMISAAQALALALQRFPQLAATGILGANQTGPPIDPAHVEQALTFLAGCRKSKIPSVHSHDLRQKIENVSLGATIAACVGLGFEVCSWAGVTDFAPHAMIGVNSTDVARLGRAP
jgi:hypothetical protein